jgi:PncC family amidohydrolase
MARASYAALVRLCSGSCLTISTAESCTGGSLGSRITDVQGASRCYLGGIVAYSNDSKVSLLGVDPRKISKYGAVSREVAIQMAEGCIERFGSDIASSITGIAGPDGGTADKTIGTVFIAVAGGGFPTICEGFQLKDIGRKRFKAASSERALGMMIGRARSIIQGGERNGPGLSA